MSAPIPAEVIAEALAKHQLVSDARCSCGEHNPPWHPEIDWRGLHIAHQASVIAALPDIEIVPLPTTTDLADYTDESNPEPFLGWEVQDGPYFVSVYDPGEVQISYDGNVEEPISVDYARDLGTALLAAARTAGGEP